MPKLSRFRLDLMVFWGSLGITTLITGAFFVEVLSPVMPRLHGFGQYLPIVMALVWAGLFLTFTGKIQEQRRSMRVRLLILAIFIPFLIFDGALTAAQIQMKRTELADEAAYREASSAEVLEVTQPVWAVLSKLDSQTANTEVTMDSLSVEEATNGGCCGYRSGEERGPRAIRFEIVAERIRQFRATWRTMIVSMLGDYSDISGYEQEKLQRVLNDRLQAVLQMQKSPTLNAFRDWLNSETQTFSVGFSDPQTGDHIPCSNPRGFAQLRALEEDLGRLLDMPVPKRVEIRKFSREIYFEALVANIASRIRQAQGLPGTVESDSLMRADVLTLVKKALRSDRSPVPPTEDELLIKLDPNEFIEFSSGSIILAALANGSLLISLLMGMFLSRADRIGIFIDELELLGEGFHRILDERTVTGIHRFWRVLCPDTPYNDLFQNVIQHRETSWLKGNKPYVLLSYEADSPEAAFLDSLVGVLLLAGLARGVGSKPMDSLKSFELFHVLPPEMRPAATNLFLRRIQAELAPPPMVQEEAAGVA